MISIKKNIIYYLLFISCTIETSPKKIFEIFDINMNTLDDYLIVTEESLDISAWIKIEINNDSTLDEFIDKNNLLFSDKKIYITDFSDKIKWWNPKFDHNFKYYLKENDKFKSYFILEKTNKHSSIIYIYLMEF